MGNLPSHNNLPRTVPPGVVPSPGDKPELIHGGDNPELIVDTLATKKLRRVQTSNLYYGGQRVSPKSK